MKVLFVCTGNTCRSPMLAQMLDAYAKRCGRDGIEVDSAGTAACGEPIGELALRVLNKRGIACESHRSKSVEQGMLDECDCIFTMTSEQRDFLIKRFGDNPKIICLSRFCGADIPDPFGGDESEYSALYDTFDGILQKLFDFIIS